MPHKYPGFGHLVSHKSRCSREEEEAPPFLASPTSQLDLRPLPTYLSFPAPYIFSCFRILLCFFLLLSSLPFYFRLWTHTRGSYTRIDTIKPPEVSLPQPRMPSHMLSAESNPPPVGICIKTGSEVHYYVSKLRLRKSGCYYSFYRVE